MCCLPSSSLKKTLSAMASDRCCVLARHYNNRNNSSSNSNGMSVRENIVDILQSAALIAREDQNGGQHEANHISEDVAVGEEIDNIVL